MMNERERLVELLKNAKKYATNTMLHFDIDEIIDTSYDDLVVNYLLENGVVMLSCKVGDTVYIIPKYNGKPYCGVRTDKVQMIGITSRGYHIKTRDKSNFNKTYMLGKTAFLTEEGAEQALKGGNENE